MIALKTLQAFLFAEVKALGIGLQEFKMES